MFTRKETKMTKISFERSGGLAGKKLQHEFDLDSLPEEEAEYLHRLIEEADFFNVPTSTVARSAPDEFQYQIIVDNGSENHTIRTTDSTMPDSLHPLVKELTMQNLLH
jgi:hypothetical protein